MCPLKEHFEVPRWLHLFDILNSPTYPYLVKDLWVRVEVYDEVATSFKEKWNIVEDKANRRKSTSEIGLKEFKEVEIRSVVMGVGVTIT